MADDFLHLEAADQKAILEAGSTKLGRSSQILLKDVWVCWVLEQLFSMPNKPAMAFKGGTSLSKAYGAISRFSEDIDVTIDWTAFSNEADPFAEGVSRGEINRLSERLKEELGKYSHDVLLPYFKGCADQQFGEGSVTFEIDKDGHKIYVHYPSLVSGDSYIKDLVLLELGARNTTIPSECHRISSDVAQTVPEIIFPSPEVDVLSGQRTFWEKATLIHVACRRPNLPANADRMSRHWSDLVRLSECSLGSDALADKALLEDVIKFKKVFFHYGYAEYDLCLSGQFSLIANEQLNTLLKKDYEQMCDAEMFYDEPLIFDEITDRLAKLESRLNS
jgi:hypothetical protein